MFAFVPGLEFSLSVRSGPWRSNLLGVPSRPLPPTAKWENRVSEAGHGDGSDPVSCMQHSAESKGFNPVNYPFAVWGNDREVLLLETCAISLRLDQSVSE